MENEKQVNTNESTRPSKEYIDDKGAKISVNDAELETANLKVVSISRLETINSLVDLKAKELCQNCRFWNATENRTTKDGNAIAIEGECRVNAPSIVYVSIGYIKTAGFPLIGPFQWCGKYEVKK